MRHLTLVVFLTLIMGFAGCGDMADAGDGAMEEMTMDEGAAMEEDAAMDEGSGDSDTPQWQVLEQNVVHSELERRKPTPPPLSFALDMDNSREIIQVLLNHGADPNVDSIDGTPLLAALYDGDMHLIRLLLEAGADPNLQFGDESPLGFALDMDNSREIVQVLLNHGADPNVCDDSYYGTPLIYTIDESNLPAVRLLLDKGADPNLSCGDTRPLGLALDGNPDIVTELISAGADVNVVIDYFQNTPLHKVAEDGNVYLAKKIIQAGADVNAINKMGSTPLIMAHTNKNHAVVRLLLQYGARCGVFRNYRIDQAFCSRL